MIEKSARPGHLKGVCILQVRCLTAFMKPQIIPNEILCRLGSQITYLYLTIDNEIIHDKLIISDINIVLRNSCSLANRIRCIIFPLQQQITKKSVRAYLRSVSI